jgi:hypothetical protein
MCNSLSFTHTHTHTHTHTSKYFYRIPWAGLEPRSFRRGRRRRPPSPLSHPWGPGQPQRPSCAPLWEFRAFLECREFRAFLECREFREFWSSTYIVVTGAFVEMTCGKKSMLQKVRCTSRWICEKIVQNVAEAIFVKINNTYITFNVVKVACKLG